MGDIGYFAGEFEHARATCRDQNSPGGAWLELEACVICSNNAALVRNDVATPHRAAHLDCLTDRVDRVRPIFSPEGRLFAATPNAENRSTVIQFVERRDRCRCERRMTDVRIRHQ